MKKKFTVLTKDIEDQKVSSTLTERLLLVLTAVLRFALRKLCVSRLYCTPRLYLSYLSLLENEMKSLFIGWFTQQCLVKNPMSDLLLIDPNRNRKRFGPYTRKKKICSRRSKGWSGKSLPTNER